MAFYNHLWLIPSILVAPNIVRSPQSIIVTAGSDITLECRATGDPIPTVRWVKNNQTASTVYPQVVSPGYGKLFIQYSNTADNGSYQCQFTNIKGSIFSDPAVIAVVGKID